MSPALPPRGPGEVLHLLPGHRPDPHDPSYAVSSRDAWRRPVFVLRGWLGGAPVRCVCTTRSTPEAAAALAEAGQPGARFTHYSVRDPP